jgi:hypothetical protein
VPIRGLLQKTDGTWGAPFANVYLLASESDYRGIPGPGVATNFLNRDPGTDHETDDPVLARMYLPVDDAVDLAVALLFECDRVRYKASGGDPDGGYSQEATEKRVLKLLTGQFSTDRPEIAGVARDKSRPS